MKFFALVVGNYDRPTKRPIDRPTGRRTDAGHRKVSLPISILPSTYFTKEKMHYYYLSLQHLALYCALGNGGNLLAFPISQKPGI